jgi:hypothetical protein
MSRFIPYLLALIIPNLVRLVLAVPELKQVHVVTRHGARTPLPKNAETLTELAGGTLTPTGQKQLYEVGTWLRQVYNANGFLEYYDPSEVRLESSNLDRTLTSANALSLGLFPYRAQAGNHGETVYQSLLPEMPGLPVYGMRESNDIYLRAYHRNCPAFHERLQRLYESSQWIILEDNNQGLLTKIASLFPDDHNNDGDSDESNDPIRDGSMVLKHLWTYYDKIKVARTECLADPTVFACTSLGPDIYQLANTLNDSEFDELDKLMGTTESLKFGIATAGNLLASQLLWRMVNRITDTPQGKFFLYSAHAPTLLALLSALQEWNTEETHPDYGSAIIMEVYQETDSASQEYSIRFLYKAARKSTAKYIPMRNAGCEESFNYDAPPATGGSGNALSHCILDDFIGWATENTIVTPEEWCDACGNESADVCLQAKVSQNNPIEQGFEKLVAAIDDDDKQALIIAATFFGGFFAGLILMGTGCGLCRRRAATGKEETPPRSMEEKNQQRIPTEVEIEAPGLNKQLN